MASLLRNVARQGCRILTTNRAPLCRFQQPACFISTSKKNKDAITATEEMQSKPRTEEKLLDKEENWMSFGYDLVDREFDRWSHNMVLFFGFSVVICWGGFMLAYMPDHKLRDWTQREAYLELARREAEGVPLVDCNLIDESKIELPSDEELGDTDIII